MAGDGETFLAGKGWGGFFVWESRVSLMKGLIGVIEGLL